MSVPGTPGDPRTGRDRRVPAKARTFKHGTVDPVTNHRRPLLTIGNLILLVIMVGFGMYATGNLPQLDAFFDHVNNYGREHNNLVVNSIITYGAFLFGALVLALVVWMVFLFVNANRRSHSDPKGWHKVANLPPERRKSARRTVDLPSMVMPVGKERPVTSAATPKPAAPAPAALAKPAPIQAAKPDSAKAAAMAAAAQAEAALADAPADLPSFVLPLGKAPKQNAEVPTPPIAATPTVAPAADTSALAAAAAAAKAEAAIAAAKAAAAKAEAAMAAAKAEAAIATAKAEAAAAEAAIAAAKAATLPS
jgi:hypothetical protein